MRKSTKSALVVSYGPVPTPSYQKIEGGGMRAWGIATGLLAQGFEVTVGVNEGFEQHEPKHQGINLINWSLNDSFKSVLNSYDAVVVSYCMGDPSVFIVDNIEDSVTLVLDAYVPIYIEVSARDSEDKKTELINYERDIVNFNHVLLRGDYLLCANTPQKHMYAGILGSLGVVNPVTYHDDRIVVVPFGIESDALPKLTDKKNPYIPLGVTKDDFVLLWFGGLYPWFDFKPLLGAIEQLSKSNSFKFVLVGGKNPYNNHPDFVKQYDYVKNYLETSKLLGASVHMVDWVDFDERIYWYMGADVVISINQPGEENVYSWRTRVMDYVWGSLPMLTNGGDPLSDYLIERGAAIRIETTKESVQANVEELIQKQNVLAKKKQNVLKVRGEFYWENVVEPLAQRIEKDPLPYLGFKNKRAEWGLTQTTTSVAANKQAKQPGKLTRAHGYYQKARQKGVKRSARFALSIGKNYATAKAQRLRAGEGSPKVVLLSHPIDETGAPLVLVDIAKNFSEHLGGEKIHVITPNIKKPLLQELVRRKIHVDKMAEGLQVRLIHAQIDVRYDDFVLINTVAVYENYRTYVYWLLETNKLRQARWFIHEDNPALRFNNMAEADRVKKLIHKGKLRIFVPSQQTANDYNKFFATTAITAVALRVEIPKQLSAKRPATSFNKIEFVTSGSPWDGRKGQFLLLNALLYFEKSLRKPDKIYRPYGVHLLAMSDDYISQQLIATGDAFFGEEFHSYQKVARDEALAITARCNVTVCSSLNETFALFVAEGMAMGHPVIRNKSAGWEEQMKDGENGYIFESLSLESLAEKLEQVLDTSVNSNEELAKMGVASQNRVKQFADSDYYEQLKN